MWCWIFFTPSYYFVIPVQIDSEYNAPLIQIEIANKKYMVKLGFASKLSSLFERDLKEINKEFCGVVSNFDIHGNDYEKPAYQISGIKIHDFFLPKMKITEQSPEYVANSILSGDKDEISYLGSLGREVFEGKNLLLDFPQSKIILCNHFKDLESEHYNSEDFIKIPLMNKKIGICFQVETDTGTKILLLNTGASASILRSSAVEESLSADTYNGIPIWCSRKFIFGDYDFGEKSLLLHKITPRVSEIDGFLGMDFLKEHAIYLDMKNSQAYIAKNAAMESSYYSVIPVRVDTKWNAPLVQVEIANKKYDFELDLGDRVSALSQTNLNEIDKELCGTFTSSDIHGNVYENDLYQISGAKIHEFCLFKMLIQEESPEFLANSVIAGDKDDTRPYTGRLGMEVFEKKNFLLDFSQSKMIMCKNFKDLARDRYKLEEFIQVPFLFNKKNGIRFQVETDSGIKTFLLDSGASISILRPSIDKEGGSTEFYCGLPVYCSKKFLLGNHDFGEKKFALLNITSPAIDGILGMDFLNEHAIYLDMEKSVAYIAKNSAACPN